MSPNWLRGALGVTCLILSSLGPLPGPALGFGGPTYSDTATLGDGVSGLDSDRTTAIESEVWAVEQVGPYMLVGGAFLEVRLRSDHSRVPRPYLAAFDPTSGDYVPWMRAQPDGPVFDIIDLGDGRAVIAGEFSSVNGVPNTEKIAVIDVATGMVDTTYSFNFNDHRNAAVRAVVTFGDWLYFAGNFESLSTGGAPIATSGLGRISLSSGDLDPAWIPLLSGGGAWAIGASTEGRVFVGGYFEAVNGLPDTETLVALEPIGGAPVAGWNSGFPHSVCRLQWRSTCGAINGLAVTNDTVFVAGAKHFWAALATDDGTILADYETSNDGQTVDLVDGQIVIGCHCVSFGGDEFPLSRYRYSRIIDPSTLHEVSSPTVNSRGAAGSWAAGGAGDGCLWTGGNFTSTFIDSVQQSAWSLLRFCPENLGVNQSLPQPDHSDVTPPQVPLSPSIDDVAGSTVTIGWSPSSDDSGQLFYLVFRNGELVGRTSGTTYRDPLIGYESTNIWQLAAVDLAGNQTVLSGPSEPVRIGPRVNVGPGSVASQVSDYSEQEQADKAIDGNASGNPVLNTISRSGDHPAEVAAWWGVDLGQVYNIDSVVIHPRRDVWFQESNNRIQVYYDQTPIEAETRGDANAGGHRVWVGDVAWAGSSPRVETAGLSAPARYLRLFGGAFGRVSFAEVEVFTTFSEPTPPAPVPDVVLPTNPGWTRLVEYGDNQVLRWGGASDDVAVAYYEVYDGVELVVRTSDRSAVVGAAGQAPRGLQVVSYDAAGNHLTDGVPSDPVLSCSFIRDGDEVLVQWEQASGASDYVVRRSVDGGAFWWRGAVDAPAAELADVDRLGALGYAVEARNGALVADPTDCAPDPTQTPTGVRVARVENDVVVINYNGHGQLVEIERDGVVVWTQDGDWFTDGGLDPGTTYVYRVRFAGSVWSGSVEATTTTPGGGAEPIQSCSWVRNGESIDVQWVGGHGADRIIIYRSVNGNGPYWRGRGTPDDLEFVDSGHTGTLEYSVAVRTASGLGDPVACT